jgi:hypothetical protein
MGRAAQAVKTVSIVSNGFGELVKTGSSHINPRAVKQRCIRCQVARRRAPSAGRIVDMSDKLILR